MNEGKGFDVLFKEGSNCALMQRLDEGKEHMLAAAHRYGRYVCPLPDGYDGRVRLAAYDGKIYVAHPTLPPLVCNPQNGTHALHHGELPKPLRFETFEQSH